MIIKKDARRKLMKNCSENYLKMIKENIHFNSCKCKI